MDVTNGQLHKLVDANPGEYGGYPYVFPYGWHASVSPKGSRIVYSSCEYLAKRRRYISEPTRPELGYELVFVNIDGTGQEPITDNDHFDNFPVWSPGGDKIAFISNQDKLGNILTLDEHYRHSATQLTIMSVDDLTSRVVSGTPTGAALYPPVWSPDGLRLAFLVDEDEGFPFSGVLYTVRLDGSDLIRLSEARVPPTWSPDSKRLAFAIGEGDEGAIYTARLQDSHLQQLVSGLTVSQVSWSPDGSEILFAAGPGSWKTGRLSPAYGPDVFASGGVFLIKPDGSELRPLPLEGRVAWSPDGTRIGVYSPKSDWRGGRPRVYTMARDGTDIRLLVEGEPGVGDSARDSRLEPGLMASDSSSREASRNVEACSQGLVVPVPSVNPGLVQDCEVLLGLRDTLSGGVELGWSSNIPISQWEGVTVKGVTPRVQEVVLVQLKFMGIVPPEFGQLSELRRLDLSGAFEMRWSNELTGAIPPELGRLAKLERLNLSRTYLVGPIPAELGNLTRLQYLNLSSNGLRGAIPEELSSLKHLEHLDLSNNALSGSIPEKLGASPTYLRLEYNDLTGPIPKEWAQSMYHLSLDGNRLSGSIPAELWELGYLKKLTLRDNNLDGCVPPGFHLRSSIIGIPGCGPDEMPNP